MFKQIEVEFNLYHCTILFSLFLAPWYHSIWHHLFHYIYFRWLKIIQDVVTVIGELLEILLKKEKPWWNWPWDPWLSAHHSTSSCKHVLWWSLWLCPLSAKKVSYTQESSIFVVWCHLQVLAMVTEGGSHLCTKHEASPICDACQGPCLDLSGIETTNYGISYKYMYVVSCT